ncbi:hypothetical protein LPMP_270080 [Leishmania panamensis]|uniref:Uncharacterized protein n=1 Tax=Leishmania panamensis TaxID=5679 RepID=A0A088RTQ0_LEIPA|nr:hypothetical protein LPMP_270080 [Leishmania panamensis]AIN99388.1 hypothetical protein LPMP_270080 [Leishmania panamensis]
MLESPAIAENVVSLLLSMLLRKKQVPMPLKEVLLSTSQPVLAMRAFEHANRGVSPAAQATIHHSRKQKVSQPDSPRAVDLLADVPGFNRPFEVAPAGTQFVILTAGRSPTPPVSENTVCLPFSLLDIAQFHRARHRERLPSLAVSSSRVTPIALLEGAQRESTMRSSFELYCRPASKDLMVVDIPADVTVDAYLWEALLAAETMLEADGVLLVMSPHTFSTRVRNFLQWRFCRTQYGVSEVCAAHYAVCSAVATDFGDAAVRRDDFPRRLAVGKRRPRKWNPYRRSEERKFVMSLQPGFTNAPLTQSALRCNVERERDAQERLRDADEAFFAVAHEMVEKSAHYSYPND